MATENPMRMTAGDSVEQELGMLLRAHNSRLESLVKRREMIPHRSGSAPPSVQGSLAAMGDIFPWPPSSQEIAQRGLGDANLDRFESEEQLRSDPSYLAYYHSHVSLNPRLPPPITSCENQRLVHHLGGGLTDKRKLTSFDGTRSKSLFSSQPVLPTHKEEDQESTEDDKSPISNTLIRQASSNWPERGADWFDGLSAAAFGTRPKSLVDLIQEDFPRTPSPVYNQSRSSSHAANEEGDTNPSLDVQHSRDSVSSSVTAVELNSSGLGTHSTLSISASVTRIPSPDLTPGHTGSSDGITDLSGEPSIGNSETRSNILSAAASTSDASEITSALQGFAISDVDYVGDHEQQKRQDQDQSHQFQYSTQHQHQQQFHAPSTQGQQAQYQVLAQAHPQNQQYIGLDQSFRNQPKFYVPNLASQASAVRSQPAFQGGGAAPQLYATAAAYMAAGSPYYQNLQSAAVYAPQYGISGYPVNTAVLPHMMSGYPSHGAMPMAYDNAAAALASNMNARSAATVLPSGGVGIGVDMQQLYKFNRELGSTMQPPLTDPLYFHYLQRSAEDARNSAALGNPSVARGFIGGGQIDPLELQKVSMVGYASEQKSQFPRSGALYLPIVSKSNSASAAYYGSPPNAGLVMHYPISPVGSPVLPGSPLVAASLSLRPNEQNFRLPLGSSRASSFGVYSGWHSERGDESRDDMNSSSLLEELKSNKTRRFELSDITGHVEEFSADQHGSRFIQQKLETASSEEKALVFQEVLPKALKLMTDVFGNYVIQKFFEHGTPQQRKELASQLVGHVLALSLQMYGCRVIQKALEVVDLDQQAKLVSELDGHVMRCVRDQNGNHVIQKCIECVPPEMVQFIISAFYGQIVILSTHPYGCRVIQRVLEHCTDENKNHKIMEEILQAACSLAQDQYGNYVVQHVLEHGKPHERTEIISKLAGQIVQMSQHKFASNVVEKCLEFGSTSERQILIDEILGQTDENENLQAMMKDQFANYVVQKVLETCDDQQREKLLARIRVHLHALKKYTYGKHIVARVEKVLAAGEKRNSHM